MKKNGSNGVQLIVVSLVLVLTVICGTIAWFANGTSAVVDEISVLVTSPSIASGLTAIEYYDNGNWELYTGTELGIVPGETKQFRVIFMATSTQSATLKLVDIDAQSEAAGSTVSFTDANSITGEIPKICSVLKYNLDGGSFSDFTNALTFNPTKDNKPELLLMSEKQVSDDHLSGLNDYTYYYSVQLPGTAGNEYMNSKISFNLEISFT